MWNVFENCWLLLTLAGVSLVIASIVRQEKPEWGLKPLLVPLLLAALAFGLDYAFTTDYEAVSAIIPACKKAAIEANPNRIMEFISPNYSDKNHKDRDAFSRRVRSTITGSNIKKIRTQANSISINGTKAKSELSVAVHLNNNSQYATFGTFFLVAMEFEYEKIAGKWYIQTMDLKSVNNQSMDWGKVP